MRKIFVLAVLAAINASAQNTSPFWSLAGNSNATAASKLGTTNNIPLRLLTNNIERVRIDGTGKFGIGITNPPGKLTVFNNGSAPAAAWVVSGPPLFVGFGENVAGSADHILALASNASSARPVFLGRRSRGTLAAPAVVANNDYLLSLFASGYDGSNFQSPAAVDFFADATPSAGNVPARISFSTGSNASSRVERLKIGSTGNINFNNGQLFLQQSTGNFGINTITPNPDYKVDIENLSGGGLIVNAGFAPGITATGSPAMRAICDEGEGLYAQGQTSGVNAHGALYGIEAYIDPGGIYAGYFGGDVFTTGTFIASDQKLKQNIEPANDALGIVAKLQPKMFEYRRDGNLALMNLPRGTHYGFIAQDVKEVLPSLSKESKFDAGKAKPGARKAPSPGETIDYNAVNYTELIPILVKAIQEQQDEIKQLRDAVDQLLESKNINAASGELGQSTPNPTRGITNVSVHLPAGSRTAQLMITDNAGRKMQTLAVNGSGTVSINTANWSGGIYHYTLMAEGKVLTTRQFVVVR